MTLEDIAFEQRIGRARRVLVIHNRYASSSPSGENTVVDMEIGLLRAAGLQVTDYQRSSDEIDEWSARQRLALPLQPVYSRASVADVQKLIVKIQPDLMHLHNAFPLISPAVVRTASEAGIPVIQTVHNFRHVCVSGVYFRDGHECQDCLGRRVPFPAVLHGCYRGSRLQSVAMAAALTAHRSTWHLISRFIALTPLISDHLKEAGFAGDRIAVKPNTVPDPGAPSPLGSGFLFAGRLTEEKGVALLLDAWLSLPENSIGGLTIAGDGPLRQKVTDACVERRDVDFVGRIEPQAVAQLMRESAVTIVPSVWAEVCPMVVIESLAQGRPVLSTHLGGLPFLVGEDGGWTVDSNVEALAAGLQRAALASAEDSRKARARYEAHFSPRTVTGDLLRIYDESSRL